MKQELGVPVLTDVHEADQVPIAAKVVDILQVPAFLARQTDLLVACGRTERLGEREEGAVHVPRRRWPTRSRRSGPRGKGRPVGRKPAAQVMLTERGTFFGYNRLVNDFTGLAVMKEFGCPVVFDVTHSTQQPAGLGNQSGGNPQYSPLLARAAVAAGVDGLFLECHPRAQSTPRATPPRCWGWTQVEPLLTQCKQIAELRRSWG